MNTKPWRFLRPILALALIFGIVSLSPIASATLCEGGMLGWLRNLDRKQKTAEEALEEKRQQYLKVYSTFVSEANQLAAGQDEYFKTDAPIVQQIQEDESLADLEQSWNLLQHKLAQHLRRVVGVILEQQKSKIIPQHETSTVHAAFLKVYKQCSAYKPGKCYNNLNRLFFAMREIIPDLQPSEFKVIRIMKGNERPFGVTAGQTWRYHVVVRFQDLILDLDYPGNETPLTTKEYIRNFFFEFDIDEMNTRELPGEIYLPWSDLIAGQNFFRLFIWERSRMSSLSEYPPPAP